MYDQHFGFSARPFQLTPDPAFFFENAAHRKALSYLGYGLAQGEGFIVITGEIGSGKSTLVAHLMANVDPAQLAVGQLATTGADAHDMGALVLHGFGQTPEGPDRASHRAQLEAHLRAEARAGRRGLLIVDEAQTLSPAALEELRLLSNLQLGPSALMQIVLLGQPEFRDRLATDPATEQLRQRVIAAHHLDPMSFDEVEPYILHRLHRVGWTGRPALSSGVFEAVHEHAGGIARRINMVMTRVLMWAAVEGIDRIDAIHVRAVIAEMGGPVDPAIDAAAVMGATPDATVADHAQRDPARPDGATISVLPVAARVPSEVAALEASIARLEARVAEQDAVVRRVLDLLIDWAEREPATAPSARGWAA